MNMKFVLLSAIRDNLPSTRQLNDLILEAKIGKKKTAELAEELSNFMLSSVNSTLTNLEELAIASQSIKCLGRYIENCLDIPLTLNTLTNNFHLLKFATNRAFPFYHQSRLLGKVVGFQHAA